MRDGAKGEVKAKDATAMRSRQVLTMPSARRAAQSWSGTSAPACPPLGHPLHPLSTAPAAHLKQRARGKLQQHGQPNAQGHEALGRALARQLACRVGEAHDGSKHSGVQQVLLRWTRGCTIGSSGRDVWRQWPTEVPARSLWIGRMRPALGGAHPPFQPPGNAHTPESSTDSCPPTRRNCT